MLKNGKRNTDIKSLSHGHKKYSNFTIYVYNWFFVNIFSQKTAGM